MLVAGQIGFGATTATVSVVNTAGGVTPRFIGYNMGHYMPGSNTSAWFQYSGVNAYRFWASPGDYEPSDDRAPVGDTVTSLGASDLTGFDFRKEALRTDLRANPSSSTYINWSYFNTNFNDTQSGRNKATLNYNLSEMQKLGADVVMQITRSNAPGYEIGTWGGKWEQWQHYYAMAYYAAKNFDVQRYQMYNEPDLDDITPAEWVQRLQLASDAVKSAIEDVNTITGKKLSWSMYAPVAASTVGAIDQAGNNFGQLALQANRTDYAGRPTNYDIFDTYDVHRYNSNGSSFTSDQGTFDSKIPGYNASGANMPIAYTEFNRYNSGTYSTRTDGPDTPLNAVEFAGIFPGAMRVNTNLAGVKAMYAFKFSQTVWNSSTTDLNEKQKTGFNYAVDDGGTYNITGSTRAAESMRLAAKAFKGERPRFQQTVSASDTSYDAAGSIDQGHGNYYYLSVNRNTTNARTVTLNLNDWGVPYNSVVSIQEVSGSSFGAGKPSQFITLPSSGSKTITFTQPSTSAWLLTLPTMVQTKVDDIYPIADAQVSSATPTTNFGSATTAKVDRGADAAPDDAAYLKFNITGQDRAKVGRAFLNVTGVNTADTEPVHVYGLLGSSWDNWTESGITWANAPGLGANGATDARFVGVGTNAIPVGQLTWNTSSEEWGIDVTEFVREHPDLDLSFVLIREKRFDADPTTAQGGANRPGDTDISRVIINTKEFATVSARPRLSLYTTPNQMYYWNINAPPDPLNPLVPATFNAAGNWDAGAPNAAGAIAVLGDFIVSPRTVTMAAAATVGELRLDSWNAYTLSGSQTLTFNGGAGAPSSINVFKGSHQIDTPITLATATTAFVDKNLGLTISKAISGSAGLTKTGAGTLVLAAVSPSFTGPVTLNTGLTRVTASDANGRTGLGNNALAINGTAILQLENVAVGAVAVQGPATTMSGGTSLRSTGTSQFNAPIALSGAVGVDVVGSLTISKPLSGSGVVTKTGTGTLVLSAASPSFTGGTNINAGLIQLTPSTGVITGLGTGPIVVNSGAALRLDNAALGASGVTGADLTLNGGSSLAATGNSSVYKSGSPMIANSGSINVGAIGTGDALSIGTAIRNVTTAASTATINLTGLGRVVLNSGGLSSSGTFAGSWNVPTGILQLGPTGSSSSEALNAPGFKSGDAKLGNLITVSGTGMLVGAVNAPQTANLSTTPTFFRAGVKLTGGSLASTGLDANFGGDFTVQGTPSVLTYDPFPPGTARSVNLVGGAAVTGLNNTATTSWSGTLMVDPGPTASTGAFNINRTGGTISVAFGSSIQIKPRGIVNLGGAADALASGSTYVNIIDDGNFNVTANVKNVGNITGVGATGVLSGATMTTNFVRQGSLNVDGTAKMRTDGANAATSNVGSLAIGASGKLDLTNNKLVTNSPLGTWTAGNYDGVLGQAKRGRDSGGASGLMTSEPLATTFLTNIAVADAGEVLSLNPGETKLWGGQIVTDTSTLAMYTYSGDANLDGTVNADDYAFIDLYFLTPGSNTYTHGDFNYDGAITADDYALIDSAAVNQTNVYATRPAPGETAALAMVPEPGALSIFACAFAATLGRRRRLMK